MNNFFGSLKINYSPEICQAVVECMESSAGDGWDAKIIVTGLGIIIALFWNLINSIIMSKRRSSDLNWDAFKEEVYEPVMIALKKFDSKTNPPVSYSKFKAMDKNQQTRYIGEVFTITGEIQVICKRADKHQCSKSSNFMVQSEKLSDDIATALATLDEKTSTPNFSIFKDALLNFSEGTRTHFQDERLIILKG